MTINTFRDRLMTTHFESFRSLKEEIDAIKDELKNQKRRVSPPAGTRIAYVMIKQVALPISRVFNSRKYGYDKCIEMFTKALVKLDLLVRELIDYGRESLAETLRHIYHRLFNLLPENTTIQHQLFDVEIYSTTHKKLPTTRAFISWLQDYVLLGFKRRDIARRRAYRPVQVVQQTIRFSISSKIAIT